jgi:hypothetical protein
VSFSQKRAGNNRKTAMKVSAYNRKNFDAKWGKRSKRIRNKTKQEKRHSKQWWDLQPTNNLFFWTKEKKKEMLVQQTRNGVALREWEVRVRQIIKKWINRHFCIGKKQ